MQAVELREPFATPSRRARATDDWPAAGAALRRALAKGGLRDTANAELLLLGVALLKQQRLDYLASSFRAS